MRSVTLALIAGLLCLVCEARADYAHFRINPDQTVEATINGYATSLPVGFRLVMRYDTSGGFANYGVYPSWPSQPNGSYWVSGVVTNDVWCYWNCYYGPFGSFQYPNGGYEQYVVSGMINGYDLSRLEGEDVYIFGDLLVGFDIDIGYPPVRQLSLFEFLSAWFANEPAADFNGNGVISVQDLFDFLQEYLT
jgi:hypothetical protein